MKRRRAYLAGPDVFFPNAMEIAQRKKDICTRFGIEGVFPLDAAFDLTGLSAEEQGHRCFDLMVELMRSCDLAIANLTPFRGPSMDVGTAVEIGYMHGLGKPVFGYTNVTQDFAERVGEDGFFVEAFGLVDNLMVEGPIARSGGRVIRAAVSRAEMYTSLQGFEKCVAQASEVFAGNRKNC
jgi:nucleoside 2-deoxyribosyltransferase